MLLQAILHYRQNLVFSRILEWFGLKETLKVI